MHSDLTKNKQATQDFSFLNDNSKEILISDDLGKIFFFSPKPQSIQNQDVSSTSVSGLGPKKSNSTQISQGKNQQTSTTLVNDSILINYEPLAEKTKKNTDSYNDNTFTWENKATRTINTPEPTEISISSSSPLKATRPQVDLTKRIQTLEKKLGNFCFFQRSQNSHYRPTSPKTN